MSQTVGIVTLNGNYNYGNRLQMYATACIYESLGFKPVVLLPSPRKDLHPKKVLSRSVKRLFGLNDADGLGIENTMSPERLAAFHAFSDAVPKKSVLQGRERDEAHRLTYLSVGSDQVWNPYYFYNYEDWFFLKFAEPHQRIALAPSIGLDVLDRRQAKAVRKGVEGFSRLSVREKRGQKLLQECANVDAELICDPTIAVPVSTWLSIASDSCTPRGDYVFAYLLGGETDQTQRILSEVTNAGRIPVVSISDREKDGELPAGPAEFIDLIKNAKHVVTDSFHGSVFATLMETPLTVVRRSGAGAGMFSRIETLSGVLGIENKIYGAPEFRIDDSGNYSGVAQNVECQRRRFLNYLTGCFNA